VNLIDDVNEASGLIDEALKSDPNNVEAIIIMGRIQEKL